MLVVYGLAEGTKNVDGSEWLGTAILETHHGINNIHICIGCRIIGGSVRNLSFNRFNTALPRVRYESATEKKFDRLPTILVCPMSSHRFLRSVEYYFCRIHFSID